MEQTIPFMGIFVCSAGNNNTVWYLGSSTPPYHYWREFPEFLTGSSVNSAYARSEGIFSSYTQQLNMYGFDYRSSLHFIMVAGMVVMFTYII